MHLHFLFFTSKQHPTHLVQQPLLINENRSFSKDEDECEHNDNEHLSLMKCGSNPNKDLEEPSWRRSSFGPVCGSLEDRRLPKQSHALKNLKSTYSKREIVWSLIILFNHIEYRTNQSALRQFLLLKILLIVQYNENTENYILKIYKKREYWLAWNRCTQREFHWLVARK